MELELTDAFHGLSAEDLAGLTDAHITTARRWLKRRSAPRPVLRALLALRFGELGALSAAWAGWALRGGVLWSPEGDAFEPGRVRAGPHYERAAAEHRAAASAALKAAESDPERRERVSALAALAAAQVTAGAALARLTAGLTPGEARSLAAAARDLSAHAPGRPRPALDLPSGG